MSNNTGKVHWSFWVIGGIALIWNVLGAINFIVQMNPDAVAAYREVERAIIGNRPAWATAGFALAVFGGSLRCLLLLFKRSVSFYVLIASAIGVIVTLIHALGVDASFGSGEIIGVVVMPIAVAGFLVWYAKWAQRKGWIR